MVSRRESFPLASIKCSPISNGSGSTPYMEKVRNNENLLFLFSLNTEKSQKVIECLPSNKYGWFTHFLSCIKMFRSRVFVFWSVLKASEMIKTLKWTPILLLQYSILTIVTGDSCRGRLTKVSHQNGFIVSFLKGRQPMKNHEFCLLGQFGGHLCFNPAQQKGLEHSMKLIGCRQEQQCYKLPHTRSPESKYENLWSLSSDSLKQIWQVSQGERASILHQTGIAKLTFFLWSAISGSYLRC